ncbi:MAG: hypothetical protein GWP69_07210 [Gammaproteobacteria bacterium]|jgi:hypothetical protein|nr:hypothetical protein [Gammaproteobacteria bacterium]
MIRVISISLVLAAGAATAGEPMDCYNDDFDGGTRYTSTEAEVLRVTDADISAMLMRIRENENRSVASAEGDPALHISLISETPASD